MINCLPAQDYCLLRYLLVSKLGPVCILREKAHTAVSNLTVPGHHLHVLIPVPLTSPYYIHLCRDGELSPRGTLTAPVPAPPTDIPLIVAGFT